MNLHFAGWQGGSGIILKSRADFGNCVTAGDRLLGIEGTSHSSTTTI